jgi:hypothetical protein
MGLNKDIQEIDGACHCGTVRFHVRLANGLHTARRCNCSYCRMRGSIAVTVKVGDLAICQGEDALSLYQFNTDTARHHFCSRCGIHTHHQRRSNPDHYGVNVACLAGLSPFDFEEIPVTDGIRHASDTGVERMAGTLRFIPAD